MQTDQQTKFAISYYNQLRFQQHSRHPLKNAHTIRWYHTHSPREGRACSIPIHHCRVSRLGVNTWKRGMHSWLKSSERWRQDSESILESIKLKLDIGEIQQKPVFLTNRRMEAPLTLMGLRSKKMVGPITHTKPQLNLLCIRKLSISLFSHI